MKFDYTRGRLIARVVYDGSASAGKTTNVRHLASALRGAVDVSDTGRTSPSVELSGRTMYFDWLVVNVGRALGMPFVCEVVSVPGQAALGARRKYLIESADAVVHVCDARRERVDDTRSALGELRKILASRPGVVIALQANKQDSAGALDGPALTHVLAPFASGILGVIEATASEGTGVVDTFVMVVDALAHSLESSTPTVAITPAESDPRALFEAIEALPVDQEWLAERSLEAAAEIITTATTSAAPLVIQTPAVAAPRAPRGEVPPGHVWPAIAGRLVLAELMSLDAYRAIEVTTVESARSVIVGNWELATELALRFDTIELARRALVRRAHSLARVARSTEGDAVLVLETAVDGAVWLWTLRPRDNALHSHKPEEK